MKYLLQQMLAFFLVIFTVILIVGVYFTQFTKRTILDNTYDQLKSYTESIEKNAEHNSLEQTLRVTSSVVAKSSQDVPFLFIDPELRILYPESIAADLYLSEELWNSVEEGKKVEMTQKMNIDQKEVSAAVVFYPLFQWEVTENNQMSSEFLGAIVAIQPLSDISSSVRILTVNFFKGVILSVFIGLIVSYLLARFQVNRINRIRSATKQIAQGNFDIHLSIKNKDELGDLAQDFNQMAIALKESNAEVKRQEERRRQFMADAAHEMRTPLTTINGLLEGLAYDAIPENQKEKCISLMQNETKRLIRLVNENLDYEKIRTNQITMDIQRFNATETLQTIVQQLEGKASASGDTLELLTHEKIDVYADYDRFVQIMVNIIQNAIQFTQDGTITIKIEKGYLETIIHIQDTGIGMSEEQTKNIWDRYYKVDPSRKNTKYGESGLGLSIVQQLVNLHHGRISVASVEGQGSTFTIVFPDIDVEAHKKENESSKK